MEQEIQELLYKMLSGIEIDIDDRTLKIGDAEMNELTKKYSAELYRMFTLAYSSQ